MGACVSATNSKKPSVIEKKDEPQTMPPSGGGASPNDNQENKLESKLQRIGDAGRKGLKELIMLLNEKEFRNNNWDKIWKKPGFNITDNDLEGSAL